MEHDVFNSKSKFDALNRPISIITLNAPGMQPSEIIPGYNEANLLERLGALAASFGSFAANPLFDLVAFAP